MTEPGRYAAVVFDWDGTLVDSTGLISRAILAAADDLGIPVPDRSRARHVIGLGLNAALHAVVPGMPPAQLPQFIARYQAHFRAGEQGLVMFEGALALLEQLHRRAVPLAVATGKSTAGLRRALAGAQLERLFTATRCADQTEPKPHPAMLLELAGELDLQPHRMLMVGDTSHDLDMAAAAGVDAVAVSYGAHGRQELADRRPRFVADSVQELADWLLVRV